MRKRESFNPEAFIEAKVQEIKEMVGQKRVFAAVSGGVDSCTCAVLSYRAVGEQLETIFIDDGLMRTNEGPIVQETLRNLGVNLKIIDAQENFLSALRGITNPEEKRKAFREAFYRILGQEVQKKSAAFLVQGTIKADIIETVGGIKTQHNVLEQIGIDPLRQYGYQVIEPLKELYKPEVRQVAKALSLPPEIYERMPFPGPGLATRIVGEVTPERVATVRLVTEIVEKELKEFSPFQAFAVLLSDRATGIKKGKRVFGQIIVIRAVDSTDAITATITPIPLKKLQKIGERITTEVPDVSRVLFDLTPKPPATIEYI